MFCIEKAPILKYCYTKKAWSLILLIPYAEVPERPCNKNKQKCPRPICTATSEMWGEYIPRRHLLPLALGYEIFRISAYQNKRQ